MIISYSLYANGNALIEAAYSFIVNEEGAEAYG